MHINKADRERYNRTFKESIRALGLAASLVAVHGVGRNITGKGHFQLFLSINFFAEQLSHYLLGNSFSKFHLFANDAYRQYQNLVAAQNEEIKVWSAQFLYADNEVQCKSFIDNQEFQKSYVARQELIIALRDALLNYPTIDDSGKITSNHIQTIIVNRKAHHIDTKKLIDQLGDQLYQISKLSISNLKILNS